MENFDLLLQSIVQNKLIKLAIGELDKLNNDEITVLAETLIKNTSIKKITITYDKIGNSVLFKEILKKIKNNELEELTLILNLDPDNIVLLADALKNNTSLIKLMLADGLLCKSMPFITEALIYNKTLLHLNLDSNFAKDESVKYLCEMLNRNCTLQSLSLQDNHFSADSIKLLVKTAGYNNQSLFNLNLNNNPGSHILRNKNYCLKLSFKNGFFNRKKQYQNFTQKKSHPNESYNFTKNSKLF